MTAGAHLSFLLFFAVLLNLTTCHLKCGHDTFEHQIYRNIRTSLPRQNKNILTRNQRNLQDAANNNLPADNNNWDNIRIAFNTEGLLSGWTNTNFKKWFAVDVIPAAIEYLQQIIKVRPIDGNLTLERKCSSWLNEAENKCKSLSHSYRSCSGYFDIEEYYFDEIYLCPNGDESDCTLSQSGGGTAHDLTLYFVGKSSGGGCSGVYGYSSYCHSNLYDRPIAGFINLCEQTLLDEGVYFTWEKAVTLVVHEVYHVLGFSSTGFAYFRRNDEARSARSPRHGGDNGDGDEHDANFGDVLHSNERGRHYAYGNDTIIYKYVAKREKTAAFIVLPTVLTVIREFYNCSTMIGLELEDFGGSDTASSHWEQRILSMEFMIGYISSAAPVSIFSFAVFEDSGWYQMNWEYATIPPYGKSFGCDWYEEKCIVAVGNKLKALDEDMYCTEDIKYACAADYVGKSNCELKEYTDGSLPSPYQYFGGFGDNITGGVLGYADFCPMFYHYSNGDCRITESSHLYDSFGAQICPQCKCNEMYSHDFKKNYAICYQSQCAQNYLYSDIISSFDYNDNEYYNDYSDYVAIRIKISNDEYDKYEYITCFRFESDEYKKTSYYSYYIKCPQFDDICYNKNPWMCHGHGMINPDGGGDECFCNHGYIGCDCTIRNTQENKWDSDAIDSTCTYTEETVDTFGSMPAPNEKDLNWDYLGLVNVTMQIDNRYTIENIIKTLRLWVAIDVKIHEENVWIQSYQDMDENKFNSLSGDIQNDEDVQNYSISIAYYDDQNQNKIKPDLLVHEFRYLFNADSKKKANDNRFILYDIYNIKDPDSGCNVIAPRFILLFSFVLIMLY